MKKPSLKSFQVRKEKFEHRLREYELDNTIEGLESFDHTKCSYIDPTEAAERMFILLAVSFAAYNFSESEKVMDWLKKEEMWNSVSEAEKEFFRHPDPSEENKQNLSWRFEGAYMIAWCLGKVDSSPSPGFECSQQQVAEFLKQIPSVGTSTNEFFESLDYRSIPEILDETLFYQLAEKYFTTLASEDKENTSSVHPKACSERSRVLSWLNSANPDWDDIIPGKEET